MSLATICQNVAADLGIDDPPLPIVGSMMPTARRLFAQARRAQWALLRRAQWSATVVEFDFTAQGASDFPIPPDLLRVINDTVWERSRFWQMRGVLSPQQWQLYKSSIYGRATLWRRWRIRVPGGDGQVGTAPVFSIDPSLASTDFTSKFVFEYQSAWGVRQAGTGQMVPDWTADDDTSILDEMLLELSTRWRMARRIGLAYDEEKEEFEREVDKAIARDGGTATLQLVPWSRFDDWIGQYTLAAFPPVGPGSGQPPNAPPTLPRGPIPSLPPDIARLVAPFEQPLPPPEDGTEAARAQVLAAWAAAAAGSREPAGAGYMPSPALAEALRAAAAARPAAALARQAMPPAVEDPVAWPAMLPPVGVAAPIEARASAEPWPAGHQAGMLRPPWESSPAPVPARGKLLARAPAPLRPPWEPSLTAPASGSAGVAGAADGEAAARGQVAAAWVAAAAKASSPGPEPTAPVIRVGQPLRGAVPPREWMPPPASARAGAADGEAAARAQVAAAWAAAAAKTPPAPEPPVVVVRVGAPLPGAEPPREWPPGTLGI